MRPTLKACALVSFVAWAGALMSGDFSLAAAQDDVQAARTVGGGLLALANAPAATTPASPSEAASASPRYVYGPGAAGMGYYQLAGTTSAPAAPSVAGFPAPARRASTPRSGGRVRDWTTGHSLPSGGLMNKPWLRSR
jgi:hypothetical protein